MKIRTLPQFVAELTASTVDVVKEASEVVRAAGFETQRLARDYVPVDTGNLKASITVGHPDGGPTLPGHLAVQVGPTADYGHYVEFGTSRIGPRPYVNKAADQVEPGFLRAMREVGFK